MDLINSYIDIKYLDKNDKKSRCKFTKTDLNVGDPAWVLTKFIPPHRNLAGEKTVRFKRKLSRKVSNEAAFRIFFRSPHAFYRLIKEKKETTRSLKTLMQDQMRSWVLQASEHFDLFSEEIQQLVFEEKLKGYLIGYFDSFQEVNRAIARTKKDIDFDFHPESENYFMKKVLFTFSIDEKKIENKLHGLKEIFVLISRFSTKFDFHPYLTNSDTLLREMAKHLVDEDLTQDPLILAANAIKHLYQTYNSEILKWWTKQDSWQEFSLT